MRSISLIAPTVIALAVICSPLAQAQSGVPNVQRAKVEQRIRDMYATLHITKAQDSQWNAFAQIMLDNAQAMAMSVQQYGGDRRKLSATQILDNYAAISSQHAQNVERLSAALNVLYAGLSPEQKRAADQMFQKSSLKRADENKR